MAGDMRATRPTDDAVPGALTDLDAPASEQRLVRSQPDVSSQPDKVTRAKAIEHVVTDPDPVSKHPVAAEATPRNQQAATVAPPSVEAGTAERPSPSKSTVNGVPNQQRTGEAEHFGCTAPQLRRFIKSRTYVPMHELRRRFGIEGDDDDVTAVDVDREHRVFVGLPTREGRLMGELFRAGDVGYELSLDPISPIVVGVFPMRPVARG